MSKTLIQRLQDITKDAQSIEKRGYNKFSNYKYVMAVDVIEEVRQLMIKHGVLCLLQENSLERHKDGSNFHSTLNCCAQFINVDDPKDCLSVQYFTVSCDTLDKDIFKAKTNGLKYLFIETFKISADLPDTENDRDYPDQIRSVPRANSGQGVVQPGKGSLQLTPVSTPSPVVPRPSDVPTKEVLWTAGQKEKDTIKAAMVKYAWTPEQLNKYMIEAFGKERLGIFSQKEFESLVNTVSIMNPPNAFKLIAPETETEWTTEGEVDDK